MKKTLSDLAVNGGRSLCAQGSELHVGYPNTPSRGLFNHYVDIPFAQNVLTNDGMLVRMLERRMNEWATSYGIPTWAVAVCNATVGLQIALRACGVRTGQQVGVPSYTFPGTINAVEWIGAKPVMFDTEGDDSYWVDIDAMKDRVYGLSALMPVAAYGLVGRTADEAASRMQVWHQAGHELGVPVIIDAAASFGNMAGSYPIVTHCDCAVMSLHATKALCGAEGAIIFTKHQEIAVAARRLRNFGFDGRHEVAIELGTNGKMSELHAAMALASFDEYISVQKENLATWRVYKRELEKIGLPIMPYPSSGDNHQYIVTRLPNGAVRDGVLEALRAEGVLARRYYWPGCHAARPELVGGDRPFPHTDRIANSVLVLPGGRQMTTGLIQSICAVIELAGGL